jgi:uncharacterized NAD(P)/FAD-binding protein YdhS/flavin reductase (DIM6/NTAB) family NADH-FMN oxidoreductase RutF
MGRLPTGVTVVSTTSSDGNPLGTTVNAVTCVSLQPPLLLVCLAHDSETLAGIRSREAFAVSILAEHQGAISSRFARKGGAKSTGVDLVGGGEGVPLLAGTLAHVQCHVERYVEAGDHEIVIGEVVRLGVAEADHRPLIFFKGEYSRLQAKPPEGGNSPPVRAVRGLSALRSAPTIAIVGGGFSGALTAAQLLRRRHPGGLRVVLVERGSRVGPGVAYGAQSPLHKLNVPAGQMSAFPDRPQHFLDWAQRRGVAVDGDAFLPRSVYGEYVEEILAEAEGSAATGTRLERVRDEAVGVVPAGRGRTLTVRLRRGDPIGADRLVLAVGNPPPHDPAGADPALLASDRYTADPWDRGIAEQPPEGSILLLGTGLTAVDVALLLGEGATVSAVSRNGLLPRVHRAEGKPPREAYRLPNGPLILRELIPAVCREAARVGEGEDDWRDVVDSLRPVTNQIWSRLSEEDRRWFVEHLARLWEVHRHRLAPEVAAELGARRASGRLEVLAGSIERMSLSRRGVEVRLLRAKRNAAETLRFDRVINCTGPAQDLSRVDDPLLVDLLRQGIASVNELRLGLEVDRDGALVGRQGQPSPTVIAIGPLRKGTLWETTAVPELRSQAALLAEHITAGLSNDVPEPALAGPTAIAGEQVA